MTGDSEAGAVATEYALLVVLIALAIMISVQEVGFATSVFYNDAATEMQNLP